ncbi:hypothetical protein HID58_017414, partial [Brassica napus]
LIPAPWRLKQSLNVYPIKWIERYWWQYCETVPYSLLCSLHYSCHQTRTALFSLVQFFESPSTTVCAPIEFFNPLKLLVTMKSVSSFSFLETKFWPVCSQEGMRRLVWLQTPCNQDHLLV